MRKPRIVPPSGATIRMSRRPKIAPPDGTPQPPAADQDPAPEPPPQRWTFTIPAEHIEDWFRAMNAARLVMSQRHECHRSDMEYILETIESGSTTRLVQYGLLTSLCDWWITALLR